MGPNSRKVLKWISTCRKLWRTVPAPDHEPNDHEDKNRQSNQAMGVHAARFGPSFDNCMPCFFDGFMKQKLKKDENRDHPVQDNLDARITGGTSHHGTYCSVNVDWGQIILPCQNKSKLLVTHKRQSFALGIMDGVKLVDTLCLILYFLGQVTHGNRPDINDPLCRAWNMLELGIHMFPLPLVMTCR
jgi:hypothetical protein